MIIIPSQKILDGKEIGRVIGVFAIGYFFFFTVALWVKTDAGSSMTLHETLPVGADPDNDEAPEIPAPPKTASKPRRLPVQPFTLLVYVVALIISLVLAFAIDVLQPAHICITVLTFYVGLALPVRVKMIVHPLLTCGFLSVMGIWAVSAIQGRGIQDGLAAYMHSVKATQILTAVASGEKPTVPGAGDFLYSILDASVVALAVRMYRERGLLRQHAVSIVSLVGILSIASLILHVALGKGLGMTPADALAMGPRFVTTPLALQIFDSSLTTANSNLGVVMVLVSGIFGDLVGTKLAWVVGADPLSLGVAVGCTSHAGGTAGLLVTNPSAGAISSLTFLLFATASVVWTTIPPIRDALVNLAT
ncbi:hypothetical protein HKX48_004849 [Thoreauomyces humboldtii]|nr:hypothetical protein HKX48_004849 [Thoreauomyces humboldtii]